MAHVLVIGDHNSIDEDNPEAAILRSRVVRGVVQCLPAVDPGEEKPREPITRIVTRVGSLGQRLVAMSETRGGMNGALQILRNRGGLSPVDTERHVTMKKLGFGVQVDYAEQRGLEVQHVEILDTIGAGVSDHQGILVAVSLPKKQ